jgi:hypothetical protein
MEVVKIGCCKHGNEPSGSIGSLATISCSKMTAAYELRWTFVNFRVAWNGRNFWTGLATISVSDTLLKYVYFSSRTSVSSEENYGGTLTRMNEIKKNAFFISAILVWGRSVVLPLSVWLHCDRNTEIDWILIKKTNVIALIFYVSEQNGQTFIECISRWTKQTTWDKRDSANQPSFMIWSHFLIRYCKFFS